MLREIISDGLEELARWGGREAACLAMLLLSASCVPARAADATRLAQSEIAAGLLDAAAAPVPKLPDPSLLLPEGVTTDAVELNSAIPLSNAPNPRAPAIVFRARSPLDQHRALQCLAEAVYYEARSESEEGQRAVAQVVLNRVRHPAYPGSVCGVVYQGPMRAGGGCQFTFTCDGSLALPPSGVTWSRARRIASDALAGVVYAPVGHATHYHTLQVLPAWGYRLAKVALVGAHIFYRIPGEWGEPTAFRPVYAGREPSPATVIATRLPINLGRARAVQPPAYDAYVPTIQRALPAPPTDRLPASLPLDRLPQSTVRDEFRNSGQWLGEAPAPSPAAYR